MPTPTHKYAPLGDFAEFEGGRERAIRGQNNFIRMQRKNKTITRLWYVIIAIVILAAVAGTIAAIALKARGHDSTRHALVNNAAKPPVSARAGTGLAVISLNQSQQLLAYETLTNGSVAELSYTNNTWNHTTFASITPAIVNNNDDGNSLAAAVYTSDGVAHKALVYTAQNSTLMFTTTAMNGSWNTPARIGVDASTNTSSSSVKNLALCADKTAQTSELYLFYVDKTGLQSYKGAIANGTIQWAAWLEVAGNKELYGAGCACTMYNGLGNVYYTANDGVLNRRSWVNDSRISGVEEFYHLSRNGPSSITATRSMRRNRDYVVWGGSNEAFGAMWEDDYDKEIDANHLPDNAAIAVGNVWTGLANTTDDEPMALLYQNKDNHITYRFFTSNDGYGLEVGSLG